MSKSIKSHITTLKQIIQPRKYKRNRAALKFLLTLDFDISNIRHALLKLNKVKRKDIINGHEISAPSFYNTMNGIRDNDLVKELTADSLDLTIAELWPE